MKLEYDLNIADYKAFKSIIRGKWKSSKQRYVIIIAVVITVSAVLWLASPWNIVPAPQADILSTGLTVALLGLFIYVIILNKRLKQNILRQRQSTRHISLTLDDETLTVVAKFQTTIWQWPAFNGATKTDRAIYVWIDQFQGIIIPQNAFSSTAEQSQIFEFIQQKIAANSEPQNPPA